MRDKIEQVLFSEAQIADRIREMGAQIEADYKDKGGLLLIGVLRGVAVFFGDMMRAIDLPLDIDFMSISSYGSSTRSSGVVRILKDLDENITGRHVVILEDIIDTGLTLSYLVRLLQERRPASLEICTLLDKPSRRLIEVPVKYTGFTIPDQFVVGYGLDYDQKFRNLPFVGVLKPEVYAGK
ncbi:MAG: hypoxanthine phosphoribosyltransferase [Cyanobacteria bacterium RYN_339]|nr:hypoxanthine phosphoribosyltransferase [Cyanobacteria bacterium RYN_339]